MKKNLIIIGIGIVLVGVGLTAWNYFGQGEQNIEVTDISIVDASDISPYLKGLEFTDKKGNIITIYIFETLSKDSVKIKEGIGLGLPRSYELITNNFIEITYPDSIKDNTQVIKVIPNGNFNTVMRLDDDADVMAMVPFSDVDDQGKEFEFRVTPINGKIIFSLINITE